MDYQAAVCTLHRLGVESSIKWAVKTKPVVCLVSLCTWGIMGPKADWNAMTKRSKAKKSNGGGLSLAGLFRPQVIGIVILVAGLVTLLSLIPGERGSMMGPWIALLEQGVGWGVWLMPVAFFGLGVWLIRLGLGRNSAADWEELAGALVLFVFGLAFVHLLAGGDEPGALAAAGGGGGYLGYTISRLLVSWFGTLATAIILVTLLVVGLVVMLPM